MRRGNLLIFLLPTFILTSCYSSKLYLKVFDKSYVCIDSGCFKDRYIQLRSNNVLFYKHTTFVSNLCVKGTWRRNEDTIFLQNIEPYIMYYPDTALKTVVLHLEDTVQSIGVGFKYDFEAIKKFIINDKDTLKHYLTSDSTLNYPYKLFSITTNEPETYFFDTTKTYRIDIHQFVMIRPAYTFRIEDFKIPEYFILTKEGLKYTDVRSEEYSEDLIFKRVSNQEFYDRVFDYYILLDIDEVNKRWKTEYDKNNK